MGHTKRILLEVELLFFLDLQETRLDQKLYPQLGSNLLSGRIVVNLKVDGCCWKIYSRRNFRGKSQHLELAFSGHPDLQIQSMKVVQCQDAI